jgi:hypothetical protein
MTGEESRSLTRTPPDIAPPKKLPPKKILHPYDVELQRRAEYVQQLRVEDGKERDEEEVLRLQTMEWNLCAADIFHWLSTYCWLEDPKSKDPEWRAFPLILWPEQVELVKFLEAGIGEQVDRNVDKAREIGVSWICCLVILHHWLFERGFKSKLGSRKQDYVDDRTSDSLFGKIRFDLDRMPDFLLPVAFRRGSGAARNQLDTTLRLLNPEMGSEIIGESSNANFGRGGRRTVIFIDEDAHVEVGIQKAMHVALTTVSASKWRVSTPNGRGNRFHDDFLMAQKLKQLGDDSLWRNWRLMGWRTDPRRDLAWFEGLLKENGGTLTWDEREQEHNCSFAGVSGERVFKVEPESVAYTDADLPPLARETWFHVSATDFGSGPSLFCTYWMLVNWDEGHSDLPMIYVDAELARQRKSAYELGPEMIEIGRQYGGFGFYTGDPAGKAAESDQESWETRLRSTGVPISVLSDEYNTADYITATLREGQLLMDLGLLKIHEERCPLLFETLESWEWDIPKGVPLERVNRDTLRPRKDLWSHSGDAAFRYGAAVAIRTSPKLARAMTKALEESPEMRKSSAYEVTAPGAPGDDVESVYDFALHHMRQW